jgi:16S rRNA (guanine1516-N2)-methyltransferase
MVLSIWISFFTSLILVSVLFENQKPIFVDFLDPKILSYLKKTNRKNTFCKALGLKQNRDHLIDMTTGFGKDSFVVSKYFTKVTWVERNFIVYLMLQDGLRRLKLVDKATADKFDLIFTDAKDFILKQKSLTGSVVYFDFMFNDKKAKSNKEMYFLKHITSSDLSEDVSSLILSAQQKKPQRCVLKAKKISETLNPKQEYLGQTVNYYVF